MNFSKKPSSSKPFALIFDMDGVIADTAAFHEKAWLTFCKKHKVAITSKLFRDQLFGRSNRETLRILFSRDLPVNEYLEYVNEKENLFRQLANAELLPLPGLVSFLKEARNAGFAIAVASSAPMNNIVFILEKTATGKFFEYITSADEITHSKPDPEIFLKTAAKLKYPPSGCLVFEDSFAGVDAGNSAGMKVIGVTTTHSSVELKATVFNIRNFNEINIDKLCSLFESKMK